MEVGGFESISLSLSREERNSLAREPECQFLEKAAQACIKAGGRASGELGVSQGQGLRKEGERPGHDPPDVVWSVGKRSIFHQHRREAPE